MTHVKSAIITGTGMAVPPRVVTNDDLAKIMDTSHEWIVQRSGIEQRRHVDEGTGPSDLALEAAKNALAMADRKAADIDLIILATLSPEHYFPGTGVFVQKKLGLSTTPALEIRNQCTGFLYAVSTANAFIKSGQYQKILVIGVEVHSRALDMTTRGRDVAVLFGDGAGALMIEASTKPETGIITTHLHAEGEFADKLWVEYPTLASSPYISPAIVESGRVHPQMDGKFVFKHAVRRIPEVITEALLKCSLRPDDIDHYLMHQANLRINEFVASSMGIPPAKCPNNIQRYGNCSAASIPMLLDERVRSKHINSGDLICMAAFGSGFTWGSSIVRWT